MNKVIRHPFSFAGKAGVHEMKRAPSINETLRFFAADEIQLQKFKQMNTHVSYWLIKQ